MFLPGYQWYVCVFLSVCETSSCVSSLVPLRESHCSPGAGTDLVSYSRTIERCSRFCRGRSKHSLLSVHSLPRLMSPMSFFFGPFPKLLLRDHEKKPRFLSALSSLPSSFSDLPERCFLTSCGLGNKYTRYTSAWTDMCNANNRTTL